LSGSSPAHTWLWAAAVVVACRGGGDRGRDFDDRPDSGSSSTAHTGVGTATTFDTALGSPDWCPFHPCAADVYVAKFTPDDDPDSADDSSSSADPATTAGTTLALAEGMLLVGAPSQGAPYHWSEVYVVRATDLSFVGSWWRDWDAFFGASVATADVDRDGTSEVAIGAPYDVHWPGNGGAYLLSGVPEPDMEVLEDPALLVLRDGIEDSPATYKVGTRVALLDLQGTGSYELIAATEGLARDDPSALYGVDVSLRGELTPLDASWSIVGPAGFGWSPTGWDGDGDGIDDLVTLDSLGAVARFASPLARGTISTDATTRWTQSPSSEVGALEPTGRLGDLTGDGLADLGLGDTKLAVTAYRAGGAYLVEGGDLTSRSVDDLPIQGHGAASGDAWGTSMASGDLDGDGQADLVLGARGMPPGDDLPGRVLAFYGPLSCPLEESAAAFVVYGEQSGDYFGSAVATYDADVDGRSEIYVGAYGHDRGAVYLFHTTTFDP
jgi:hypothetical protein